MPRPWDPWMILIGFFLCHRSRSQSTEGIGSSRLLSWSASQTQVFSGEKIMLVWHSPRAPAFPNGEGEFKKGCRLHLQQLRRCSWDCTLGPAGPVLFIWALSESLAIFSKAVQQSIFTQESGTSHGPGHPKPSHTSDYHPLKTGKEHLVAAYYDHKEVCLDFPPQKSTRIQGSLWLDWESYL